MSPLFFDIETSACDEGLRKFPFDESTVNLGVMKDEAKIEAKIDAARKKHRDLAALDAGTGKVLAVGFSDGEYREMLAYDEPELLVKTWERIGEQLRMQQWVIGFNIKAFDLPFLCTRSHVHRIEIPSWLADYTKYDPWHSCVKDIRQYWQMGDRQRKGSLDYLARLFGVGSKPKNIHGGDFARLFNGTEEQQEQARQYLMNDLAMTESVAKVLLNL
jgi:hypothetical protein